ncbi:hypothetical protein F4805DRAFT_425526 [Annulohypoxylon moriforme]|nr:hypothetical protein F4805DRAFT_425526 [Annulohypoxylon moriforme]
MEVVGVVAAIPGLIDIIKRIKTTVQDFTNRKILSKETTNLIAQLDLINQILVDIQGRWDPTSFHRSNLNRLPPAIASLKNDLDSLNSLLSTKIPARSRSLLLKQAMLMVSGFEAKVKHHVDRLEKTKSLLMLVILAHGDEVAEASLSTTRANLRLELKDLLRPRDHNFIPSNLSGTCEWIWTNPTFSRWLNVGTTNPRDYAARMMCIYGTKGCGKSVLAASIVDRLKAQGKVAALFSFWAGRESQRKLTDFLRTLLWHLLQHIPDKDIQTIYTPLARSLPFNHHNLGDAIKKSGVLIGSPIYCVLDAIDEAADDWSQSEDGGLKYMLELLQALPNFRLLLLGREPAMRTAKASTTLAVEITEDTVRHDIHKFIDVELDRSLKVQTPIVKQLVRQSFHERSTTMFLWVSLVFTELNRCYLASEIEQTLEHIPHDLDREYHRLFAQLILRLGGNPAHPSVSLQRTKCLLSLIIAAPEPLTCDELRHAFALCQHPQPGFEGYLIESEGIIDSVGDFVRVSDGRFHIAHASLTEFLIRDVEDWIAEDEPIIFFRIDVVESHTTMCLACFDYLLQSDLGYPMTDDSPATLPERLVFFGYASREIPNHIMEIGAAGLSIRIVSKLHEFLRSIQFCAFIEYLALCFQHDEWTLGYSYTMLWRNLIVSEDTGSKIKFPGTLPNMDQLFRKELGRREAEFGSDHTRCQSWRSLMIIIGVWTVELHQIFDVALADEIVNSHNTDYTTHEIVVEVAAGPISDVPRHLITNQHVPLKGVSQFVLSIFQHVYQVPYKFPVLSADNLPTPFLLLWSTQVPDLTQKISLVSVALKRVKGQKGFTEGLCLLYMGALLQQQDEISESVERLYRRGLEIAIDLRPLPHVEWLVTSILMNLASYLNDCNRRQESRQTLQQLRERILGMGTPMCFRIFPGKIWSVFKTEILYRMAVCYRSNGDHEETCRLADLIITNQGKRVTKILPKALTVKGNALFAMKEFEAAEQANRDLLQSLDALDRNQQLKYSWIGIANISACLYNRNKNSEVKDWIRQIDSNMPVNNDTPSYTTSRHVWQIGKSAAYIGEYELASQFFLKALLSRSLIRETTTKPKPRITNLATLAETLEAYRPVFESKNTVLDCCQLYAAWSEDVDCFDDEIWWRDLCIKIRRGVADFNFDIWDIAYLKCIDLLVPRHGILSSEIETLYLTLIRTYELDGEHEAANAVQLWWAEL